jgi:hypothetical protein
MIDSVEFWRGATGWLWALLIPLIFTLWGTITARINRVEKEVETKASASELNRSRDVQRDIFAALTAHDLEDRRRFETLQIGMGRIEGKVDALVNRPRYRERKDDD